MEVERLFFPFSCLSKMAFAIRVKERNQDMCLTVAMFYCPFHISHRRVNHEHNSSSAFNLPNINLIRVIHLIPGDVHCSQQSLSTTIGYTTQTTIYRGTLFNWFIGATLFPISSFKFLNTENCNLL